MVTRETGQVKVVQQRILKAVIDGTSCDLILSHLMSSFSNLSHSASLHYPARSRHPAYGYFLEEPMVFSLTT